MRLSQRALERTLLLRQHLLERTDAAPAAVVAHLLGLQAQDTLPPYLALAARVEGFDPRVLSRGIADRSLVRLLTMRGTVHVLDADDALVLRTWVQPVLDRAAHASGAGRPVGHLAGPTLVAETTALLADGPLPLRRLGELLALGHPGEEPGALAQVARECAPLVQVPPRGLWRRPGGVVHAHLEHWLDRPQRPPDVPALVRRYLAAYGPARAADVTTWSGVTRLGPALTAMADDLEVHEDPSGRRLYDVPGAPLAAEDAAAPVRLLGRYDNVWLSHADRDRVLVGEGRRRWSGPNGGVGNVVLLDGRGEGTWTAVDGRVVTDLWRTPTRTERDDLAEESARVEALLAVPPDDDPAG